MAGLAAQMLLGKAPIPPAASAPVVPLVAPATAEQVQQAIVKIVKCLDGDLPLGAKAVAYIEKSNLPVAALPIETVQQVLLAAAMQEASLSEQDAPAEEAAAKKKKARKKRAKGKVREYVYPEMDDRVRDEEGYYGSVKYIGPVCTAKNQFFNYVGVEWDVAGRGKHDGAVKTEQGYERYFDCEMGYGSFVKPNKLTLATTFLGAMRERYEHGGEEEEVINAVDTLRGKTKPITLVGMDKVAAWHKLDTIFQVSLEGCNVGKAFGAGDAGSVGKDCPRIRELNLRKTMFGTFEELAKLGNQLPKLTNLEVSANRFRMLKYPLPADHLLRGSFPALKVLVLTDTNMTWGQVASIDEAVPHLEELHLNSNKLSSFDLPMTTYANWSVNQGDRTRDTRGAAGKPITGFNCLKKLNLSQNEFNDWRQIWRLGWLPALETLLLNDNQLEAIEYLGEEYLMQKGAAAAAYRVVYDEAVTEPKTAAENASGEANHGSAPQDFQEYILKQKNAATMGDHTEKVDQDQFQGTPFHTLKSISLDRNKIASWASFDALNEFASLDTLRFSHNPLTKTNSGNVMRQTVIARVGKINLYNGSEVRQLERMDSERLYLKRVLMENQNEGKTETIASIMDKVKEEHPRLGALLKMHGEPLVKKAGANGGKGSSIANSMIKVALMSNCPASCTVPVKRMTVLETMTVATLKLLCQRRFKLDASEQSLFYRDNSTCGHPIALDDDTKDIGYFGVKDGGEIIMEELSAEQQQAKSENVQSAEAFKKAEEEASLILAAKKEIVDSQKQGAAKAADAIPFVSKFR